MQDIDKAIKAQEWLMEHYRQYIPLDACLALVRFMQDDLASAETVQVKITSSTRQAWYAGLEGRIFEVNRWYNSDYVLKEDYDSGLDYPWRHISKNDCVEVEKAN